MRLKKLKEDDWDKLKRVLKYLTEARELKLTLIVGDMSVVKWLVGALYAVNEYCKGHKGDMISLGKVAVSSFSTKQKINVKSST